VLSKTLARFSGFGSCSYQTIDTGWLQALIKQLPGRPHKWSPQLIFTIPGLFPHQKNRGMCFALAKDYLGRVLVKIATLTTLRRLSQAGQIVARRQELQGGPGARGKEVPSSFMMQYLASGISTGRSKFAL
jgi:hypothetical protein